MVGITVNRDVWAIRMSWDIDQAISMIEGAATVEDLTKLLQMVAEDHGFNSFSFVDGLQLSSGKPLVINTISEAFDRDYRREGFVSVDPVIPVWRRTNTPFSWGDVVLPKRLGKRRPGALKTMEAARDHGYREGLVIPFHYVDRIGRPCSSACTFFWTDPVSKFLFSRRQHAATLHIIMLYWAQRVVDLSEASLGAAARFRDVDELGQAPTLTDRERDVLSWAARGKTVQDTADILGISADTVETHVRACLRKLNASTKTQAVARAIYLWMIDV